MGVDGFRFDLASVFTRNEDGSINTDSPAIAAEISAIALKLDLRLVAEAWDINAYQLGRSFPDWRGDNGTGNSAMMCARLLKAMPEWLAR